MPQVKPPRGFPSSLNILGADFKVTYYDTPGEVSDKNDGLNSGYVYSAKGYIKICTMDRSRKLMWRTLIHEILHVIDDELSVLSQSGSELEKIMSQFSVGIQQVIFDNKLKFN